MRVRRRAKLRREGFTAAHRAQLLTGVDMFQDVYGNGARLDAESAQRDWAEHREALLAFWLQDPPAWHRSHRRELDNPAPGGPLTRPWAWWSFDAPRELRLVLAGAVEWLSVEDWPRQTSFGKPTRFVADPRAMIWEAEAVYLARHGLLTPAEQRAAGAPARRAR